MNFFFTLESNLCCLVRTVLQERFHTCTFCSNQTKKVRSPGWTCLVWKGLKIPDVSASALPPFFLTSPSVLWKCYIKSLLNHLKNKYQSICRLFFFCSVSNIDTGVNPLSVISRAFVSIYFCVCVLYAMRYFEWQCTACSAQNCY